MSSILELRLIDESTLEAGGKRYECRIGRGGLAEQGQKREGDLKTPRGLFPLRCVYYRPDRAAAPRTALPVIALTPEDGWCDDAGHPMYNRPVKLPFDGRHEKLWREAHVYDLIIPLGYNDGADASGNPTPITPGAGSAIFLHLIREDGAGTEGCVAMKQEDLEEVLTNIVTDTMLVID